MSAKFDCVYYWTGGTERGRWNQANAWTREGCRRAGYVAHDGCLAIGAPTTPPTSKELAEVGALVMMAKSFPGAGI